MRPADTTRSRRGSDAGRFALVIAILLIFAQTAAAAHYHLRPANERANLSPVTGAGNTFCALCLLAFHVPVNPSAAPAVMRPQPVLNASVAQAPEIATSIGHSSAQTRGPPAV